MKKVTVITSLYNCIHFIECFLNHILSITNREEVEFLLLHNDPSTEELEIISKYTDKIVQLRHVIIREREGLYKTWNRGIKLSNTEYITIWNVDDIRFPDSLLLQAKALDENPDAAIAYGDIYASEIYGKRGDNLLRYPLWQTGKEEFFRSYLMSCFQMWRKSIHAIIGYYDEQFKCVGDFDFQIRAAIHFPFTKTDEPLGIYLNGQPHKISSSPLQLFENNIVYLRYGVFEKIYFHLLKKSVRMYDKDKLLFYGEWVKNEEVSPFSKSYQAKGEIKGYFKSLVHLVKTGLKKLVRIFRGADSFWLLPKPNSHRVRSNLKRKDSNKTSHT